MASGALYVSNPRRGKRRAAQRRRNPLSEAKIAQIDKRVQKIDARLQAQADRATASRARLSERAGSMVGEYAVLESMRERAAEERRNIAEDRKLARELGVPYHAPRSAVAGETLLDLSGGSVATRRRRSKSSRVRKGRKSSARSRTPRRNAKGHFVAKGSKSTRRRGWKLRHTGARTKHRQVYRSKRSAQKAQKRLGRGHRVVRNPLVISNPLGGIPVIGTAVSMIGPAIFAVIGIEGIGQLHNAYTKWGPEGGLPEAIQPYSYTIGGLLLSGIVQLITPIPANYRNSLSVAFASAGASVDWYRMRQADGAYGDLEDYSGLEEDGLGDGGNWSVEEYGDLQLGDDEDAYGDLQLGDPDDFEGDEDYAGLDFSEAEGEAAAEGYGAFARRFPVRRGMAARRARGQVGQRWHWLARITGPADFKVVANMQPAQRLAMIEALKAAAKGLINVAPAAVTPPAIIAQQYTPAVPQITMAAPMPSPISMARPQPMPHARPMGMPFESFGI